MAGRLRKSRKTVDEAGPSHVNLESEEEEELSLIDPYFRVQFASSHQRNRFLALMDTPMLPTRFINTGTLVTLGLKVPVYNMLREMGCGGITRIREPTYKCLTLEFLSSFEYNVKRAQVSFRLYNTYIERNLEDWGHMLGVRAEGSIRTDKPRDMTGLLWRCLTGLTTGGDSFKFKAHLIHHPVIRIVCRLISSVYFPKPEQTNMTQREVHILASYLNVDNGERFDANVAHWVAKHIESVSRGVIKEIHIGGLVTHIAKRVFGADEVTEDELIPLVTPLHRPLPNPLTFDLHYLVNSLYYLAPIDPSLRSKRFWWRLLRDQLVQLPRDAGELAAVLPMPHDPTAHVDVDRYLLVPRAPTTPGVPTFQGLGQDAPLGHPTTETQGPRAEVPTSSRHYTTPTGDYSRFEHYPFQRPPYDVSYYDPSLYPETFIPPTPFSFPPLPLTQDSRDSMMLGMMHSFQQFQLDNAVGQHNIYAYHAREGHFLPQDTHPGYYRPVTGQGSGFGGTPMTGGAGFMGDVGTAVFGGDGAGCSTATGGVGDDWDGAAGADGDNQFYGANDDMEP